MLAKRLERIVLAGPGSGDLRELAPGLAASAGLELPSPRRLASRLAPWLGKPLSTGALAALADEILVHYDAEGYPVVIIEAPDQDLSKGELRLSVEIGRYGETGLSKPKYGNPEKLQRA